MLSEIILSVDQQIFEHSEQIEGNIVFCHCFLGYIQLKGMLLLCGQLFEAKKLSFVVVLYLEQIQIFSVRLPFPPNFLNLVTVN